MQILKDIDFRIEYGERVGILGRNGAGKSTMVRLISGAEKPDSGTIDRSMSVSWPLAFSGGFQGSLTGLDNLRFVCRIYGEDWRDHMAFVEDFTELGRYFREPVNTYSSGMLSRLAFAISMVINFDCFLIDEIMAVGDQRFHERCHIELFEKRASHAMVIVSHDAGYVRAHCKRLSVIKDGKLYNFEDNDEAYHFYFTQ
ncbi:ABC transporter ATP-binding protein [Novosphingobium sp.]|uniref:ABC transporter ATP-binding protein n=1 Tax=Novosphingobium sp. TaxID=1874826 RepID=UPI00345397D5